jgi:hypothetical protein
MRDDYVLASCDGPHEAIYGVRRVHDIGTDRSTQWHDACQPGARLRLRPACAIDADELRLRPN